MTGKTTLLKGLAAARYYDLLSTELYVELSARPEKFREEVLAIAEPSLIVVDEVQRIPELLDAVQTGIEARNHRFILSGSSPRKLRRGSANLLGGRALDLRLHPLTTQELGNDFSIGTALSFGTLPKPYLVARHGSSMEASLLLKSYYTTYIDQEIKQEALTRNVGAFQRFLQVAAQYHAQEVVYSNISNKSQVPASTVKEYFSILEDTLIGIMLWHFSKSEKNKNRGKFYLFDPGVVRSIQNRLHSTPSSDELGHLFEGWFIYELHRIRDYAHAPHTFSFWKRGALEIDVVVEVNSTPILAFEIKSGNDDVPNRAALKKFKAEFPKTPCHTVSLTAKFARQLGDDSLVLPWNEALDRFREAIAVTSY